MSTVIKVENLSKQYRLGQVGTGTLGHDLNRWWYTARGKEDPYLKIGEENDQSAKGGSDYVWALKDISFEVNKGEVLGIIGRNGAGKSTLLKILSRTTSPTTGNIKIKGRVASLLEVGTGFHPDLSGRDNIYLNGAILGMTKTEIKRKFDEIVDFAGVDRYIDTPVKRYSSGMYVRLAFGVAAHLEPEILIIDEVLAVGDLEFQKKAFGKMKDVSNEEGRTVLFVSHNISALKRICNRGLLIQNGILVEQGNILDVAKAYENEVSNADTCELTFNSNDRRLRVEFLSINGNTTNILDLGSSAVLNVQIEGYLEEELPINLEARFLNIEYVPLAFFSPGHVNTNSPKTAKGKFRLNYHIQLPPTMNQGRFILQLSLTDPGRHSYGSFREDIQVIFGGIVLESGLVFDAMKAGWLFLK